MEEIIFEKVMCKESIHLCSYQEFVDSLACRWSKSPLLDMHRSNIYTKHKLYKQNPSNKEQGMLINM